MTYQKRKEMTDRHHTNHRMPLYRYHRPGVQLRLLCVFLTVLLVFNAVAIVPVIASDAPSTKEVHPDCFEFETYPEAVTNDKNDERLIRIDTDNDPLNVIKYYVGENNYESLVFPIDVKYIDENGIYKDKSNKLYESENVGLSYENRDNNIKTYFPSNITSGITSKSGNYSVTIIPYNTNNQATEPSINDNIVSYENVFGHGTTMQVLYSLYPE